MMLADRMRDMYDPWVTEYRGQFNYAIPQQQEVQSFMYDYDNKHHLYPHQHPSFNAQMEDMPPHPAGFYNNNGQYHDALGRPSDPPPPPPLPRKRMSTKKKVVEDNTRKVAVKSKGFTTFNNKITVPESPHFQSTKVANRHRAIVDTAGEFKNTRKDTSYGTRKGAKSIYESVNQGKRLYHPLNYDRAGNPKATYTAYEIEPSPLPLPTPHAAPVYPSYSPFSTHNATAVHVRQVEPSPHTLLYPHTTPPLRGPDSRPSATYAVHRVSKREQGVTTRAPSSPPAPPPSLPPTPPPLPPQPRPAFQVREVEMSPHSSPPPPPPLPPTPPPVVSHGLATKKHDTIPVTEVRTIVPPMAFSREPSDKSTIPAHICTHQWHNDSDLYWSSIPNRQSPPLECAMCFARPHPNEYTKSFDPSRWLELNPKFYKYMPAQSLRKIPAAGKAVPRSAEFSVASMYY